MKYKKISFNYLVNQLKNNNKMYVNMINMYIDEYLKKFLKINNIKEFITYNEKYSQNFITNGLISLSFHLLIDEKNNRISAIEKVVKLSNKFFDIKYFKELKKYCDVSNDQYIYYAINLFVDKEYRGQRLCQKLLKKIKEKANEKNVLYVISEIHNENIASIKCHEHSGFIKTDIMSYKETPFYFLKV